MNSISIIPEDIGNLESLTELVLSNNNIQKIPKQLSTLSQLKELKIAHNKIDSIPAEIQQLKQLETFALEYNELSELPPETFKISSLIVLDLAHNKLASLPSDMEMMKSLTQLNLTNNFLSEIPKSIGKVTLLQELLVYNNNLTGLPTELVECRGLIKLALGGNTLLPTFFQLGLSSVLSYLQGTPSDTIFLHDWEINFTDLELKEPLGQGAFGQVFLGKWRENVVAIKKLFAKSFEEPTLREFRREVEILSSLKPHKHLVRYYGACTQPPNLCIVTEYIARGSLHDLLHTSPMKLTPSMHLKIAQGTALGCHYLMSHDPPVYHCDLKTKNLLITADWDIKLVDFGQSTFDTFHRTGDWTYVRFAAPEVMNKQPHSEKSEVYSYGVILWELLTRKIPYLNQDAQQIKSFVQNGGRLEIPDNCPPTYQRILLDCWQEDTEKRPTFMDIYMRLKKMEANIQVSM